MNSYVIIELFVDWIEVKWFIISCLVRFYKDWVSGGCSWFEIVGVKDYFEGIFFWFYVGKVVYVIGVGKGLFEFFFIDV